MFFSWSADFSIVADREPRYKAPRDELEGIIKCMGVHMARITSGGRPSKRIMVLLIRMRGCAITEIDHRGN